MKHRLYIFLFFVLVCTMGFSQTVPLSYYSPNASDTIAKKYIVALVSFGIMKNIFGNGLRTFNVNTEITYLDASDKKFFASVKTQRGRTSSLSAEIGKKLGGCYFYISGERNVTNSVVDPTYNTTEFTQLNPFVYGVGIKFYSYKQKSTSLSRVFEWNFGTKRGNGTFNGYEIYINESSTMNEAIEKKVYTERLTKFGKFFTDMRVMKMKKFSKMGIAWSAFSIGANTNSRFKDVAPFESTLEFFLNSLNVYARVGIGVCF